MAPSNVRRSNPYCPHDGNIYKKGPKGFQPLNTLGSDGRRSGVTFDLSDTDVRRRQFKRFRQAAGVDELDPIEIESEDDLRAGKRPKGGMELVAVSIALPTHRRWRGSDVGHYLVQPARATSRDTKGPQRRPLLDREPRHGSNPSCHVEDVGKMLLSSLSSDVSKTRPATADEEEDEALAARQWQGTANLRPPRGGRRSSYFQSTLPEGRIRSGARVPDEDAYRLSKPGNGPKTRNQRWTRAQSPAAPSQQLLLDARLSHGASARGAPPSPKISEIQKAAPRQRPERQSLYAGRAIDDPNDVSIPTGSKPRTTVNLEQTESVPDSVSTRGDIAPTQFRAKGRDRLDRRALEHPNPSKADRVTCKILALGNSCGATDSEWLDLLPESTLILNLDADRIEFKLASLDGMEGRKMFSLGDLQGGVKAFGPCDCVILKIEKGEGGQGRSKARQLAVRFATDDEAAKLVSKLSDRPGFGWQKIMQ